MMSIRQWCGVGIVYGMLWVSEVRATPNQVATLTQLEGDVKLFTRPGKQMQGPPPRALFEGEIYSVKSAVLGDKVERGNILRTAPGAKARVVYDNGDQFNVGPATAYRITWSEGSGTGTTDVNLMYGKLRGVIEKGGPRKRLQVRTKAATMGVRGTDFFIADGGPEGGTEVTIMRGEVEVKSPGSPSKPVAVKAGMSAEIPAPPVVIPPASVKGGENNTPPSAPVVVAPVIAIRQATQQELVAVQKNSEIKQAVQQSEGTDRAVTEKLRALEAQAVKTTLNDIKQVDPELFKKLSATSVASTNDINSASMETLVKVAPRAPEKRKPSRGELDDLGNGAYEKYFKSVE